MRGRRAKAIRLALGLPRKFTEREYEEAPVTRRTRTITNLAGEVVNTYDTWTLRLKQGSPRSVYQRVKRRFLA